MNRGRDEAIRIAAPSLTTGNRAATISADGAVIASCNESTASLKDVLERLSLVNADLQHATIKTEIGIFGRGFEIEVMSEGQLLADRLEDSEAWQVQQLVTYHARIIDEGSIWQCICGWTRQS